MNVLDLFSGAVGGWSLGLHRAGFATVAACEIDPWRRGLYGANFPAAKLYGDIRELTADRLVSDLGFLPDIIAGSPPCQDASAANTKGRGIDGAETGLFLEALRLVREVRPAWALFENSPRLRTRGVDRVLGELDAAGYARWPLVVGADDLGAPHERKRMWLIAADTGRAIAKRRGTLGGGQRRPEEATGNGFAFDAEGIRPTRGRPRRRGEEGVTGDPDSAGLEIGQSLTGDARAQFEALERAIGPAVHTWNGGAARHLRMAHGLAPRLAGIRVPDFKHPGATINAAKACISAQGDCILPQIAEAIGRAIMTAAFGKAEDSK